MTIETARDEEHYYAGKLAGLKAAAAEIERLRDALWQAKEDLLEAARRLPRPEDRLTAEQWARRANIAYEDEMR